MMPTLLIAAALAFAQAPAASHAGSDTVQPAAPAASAQADAARSPAPANTTASIADEKRTCRKERRTGSNMVTRVCRTASERRKDADAARDALRNGRSIDNLDIGAQ